MRLLISMLALVSFMGTALAQEGGMDPGSNAPADTPRAPAKKHGKKGGKKKKSKKHKTT